MAAPKKLRLGPKARGALLEADPAFAAVLEEVGLPPHVRQRVVRPRVGALAELPDDCANRPKSAPCRGWHRRNPNQ